MYSRNQMFGRVHWSLNSVWQNFLYLSLQKHVISILAKAKKREKNITPNIIALIIRIHFTIYIMSQHTDWLMFTSFCRTFSEDNFCISAHCSLVLNFTEALRLLTYNKIRTFTFNKNSKTVITQWLPYSVVYCN